MRLTVEGFALKIARIRRVLEYLDAHLDEDVSLAQLAELACLSPSQLERLYVTKIGEPPLATHRRLRLKRSYEQIRSGRTSLMSAALAAGYGSQAAFSRAFTRQFGHAPSRLRSSAAPLDHPPVLRLELLAAREVLQLPYRGADGERNRAVGHLMGKLAVAGARRWRTWTILDRDNPLSAKPATSVEVAHFVPAHGQPHEVRGVDRLTQPGGLYAVHEALVSQQATQLASLAERIRRDLDCEIAEGAFGGRIVMRDITVPWYTAPQERRVALYIPVRHLR